MAKMGTTRVLEYARLAMGFANGRAGTRVLMLVLVQAGPAFNAQSPLLLVADAVPNAAHAAAARRAPTMAVTAVGAAVSDLVLVVSQRGSARQSPS